MMNEALVLLPDVMCDARLFGSQLAAFGRTRTVVLAPVTGGDRVEEIASNLLDVLPRKCALAGQRLGATVAMELLRRAPDRVTRLALMGAGAFAETPQSAADLESAITKARAGNIEGVVEEMLARRMLAPGTRRAEVTALVRDMAGHLGAETIARQLRAMQRRRDYQTELRRCRLPALVLCGAQDDTSVKHHGFLADLIPHAALSVVEAAGRLPTLEQPDATTRALRAWLDQPAVQR